MMLALPPDITSGIGITFLAARVAAQLARDAASRDCEDVSRDAIAMAMAAIDARGARFSGQPAQYQKAIERLTVIADLYGVAVVEANDPSGMIVGLDLGPESTHRSGHNQNWFYLA